MLWALHAMLCRQHTSIGGCLTTVYTGATDSMHHETAFLHWHGHLQALARVEKVSTKVKAKASRKSGKLALKHMY